MVFKRLPYIEELFVKGYVNDKNPKDVIDQIVYLDEDIVLKFPLRFHKPVSRTILL